MPTQRQKTPIFQADDWFTIVPSDTVTFALDTTNNPTGYSIASIFVGTTGDLSVTSVAGITKIFKNVASGTFMPIIAVQVNATGTTASNILGCVSVLTS